YKFSLFAGVVQEWRRHHVWSWLLHGFGGGRQANTRGTAWQGDDLVVADDVFDLRETVFIKRQNRIAHDLLLFQLADYIAIIARRQMALLRDLSGDRPHLGLNFLKGLVRHRRELIGRNVDPEPLQAQGIILRGKPKVGTGFGQNGSFDPNIIVRKL